jgi:hypothetical protein
MGLNVARANEQCACLLAERRGIAGNYSPVWTFAPAAVVTPVSVRHYDGGSHGYGLNPKRNFACPGLFEAASGATFFLDEVDALPLALQGELLKAIEEKRVPRVGALADKPVDIYRCSG